MGYQGADGRYRDTDDVTLQASVTKTATFTGAWVEVGDRGTLRALLTVSAASGTNPTADVIIETARDSAGTGLRTIATFTQATDVTTEWKSATGCDRFARAKATVGGTNPSFTYSVAGAAV